MLGLELLARGSAREIYALVIDNRCSALDYIEGLPQSARRKLDALLRRLAETGTAGHRGERVKRLKGVVFEMKEHETNTRLFCFAHGRRLIVCTHGTKKPGGNARYNAEIAKVLSLYDRCKEAGILP